jgi:hypothetical protein
LPAASDVVTFCALPLNVTLAPASGAPPLLVTVPEIVTLVTALTVLPTGSGAADGVSQPATHPSAKSSGTAPARARFVPGSRPFVRRFSAHVQPADAARTPVDSIFLIASSLDSSRTRAAFPLC